MNCLYGYAYNIVYAPVSASITWHVIFTVKSFNVHAAQNECSWFVIFERKKVFSNQTLFFQLIFAMDTTKAWNSIAFFSVNDRKDPIFAQRFISSKWGLFQSYFDMQNMNRRIVLFGLLQLGASRIVLSIFFVHICDICRLCDASMCLIWHTLSKSLLDWLVHQTELLCFQRDYTLRSVYTWKMISGS